MRKETSPGINWMSRELVATAFDFPLTLKTELLKGHFNETKALKAQMAVVQRVNVARRSDFFANKTLFHVRQVVLGH